VLGSGIAPADVILSRSTGGLDDLTLSFADGTSWSRAVMQDAVL
jgi:hypothetical protein